VRTDRPAAVGVVARADRPAAVAARMDPRAAGAVPSAVPEPVEAAEAVLRDQQAEEAAAAVPWAPGPP
jgi:hypothetical protein